MLNVVMLNVVMLNVVAPTFHIILSLKFFFVNFYYKFIIVCHFLSANAKDWIRTLDPRNMSQVNYELKSGQHMARVSFKILYGLGANPGACTIKLFTVVIYGFS
jgi:hypothetical protein